MSPSISHDMATDHRDDIVVVVVVYDGGQTYPYLKYALVIDTKSVSLHVFDLNERNNNKFD